MIVATAGHVDHGKTALVKALTGVDTDRLPEEKARGLTIDLGFAYRALDESRTIGFVDVPGHEKFIKNMLAGVGGIDLALLVVAGDDGVMPQTREHLAILELLGISQCIAVVSKIDKIDRERMLEVEAEVGALIDASTVALRRVHRVCALDGTGIEALREELDDLTRSEMTTAASGGFRLAIDRVFSLKGVGLVATGTVFSGRVATGDRLVLGPARREARVRGIRSHDRPAEEAREGERCALNISGRDISEATVERGHWLLSEELCEPSDRIDVRLRVLPGESRALKHWTPVHLHHGAAHHSARVAVLGGGGIEPGESGLVQLVLDRDAVAVRGDRVVLRDQSASRTIAGGMVIDPFSPRRGRARPARLAWLRALEAGSTEAILREAVAVAPGGVAVARLARILNFDPIALATLADEARTRRFDREGEEWLVAESIVSHLREAVMSAVSQWHAAHPGSLGPNPREVRMSLPDFAPDSLVALAVGDLAASGKLGRRGLVVHLPDHEIQLPAEDEKLWPRIRATLAPADASPPSLLQASEALGMELPALQAIVKRALGAGRVLPITKNRFVPTERVGELAKRVEELATSRPDGLFTVAEYRDRSGVGRNFAIELLEYFDRLGFTERMKDRRRVRRAAADVFGDPPIEAA